MRICEMEPKIDSFGLDKIEVKLEHSQVHWFICANSLDDIIVYDKKGEAWLCVGLNYDDETKFDIEEVENDLMGYKETIPMINGHKMIRAEVWDLEEERK